VEKPVEKKLEGMELVDRSVVESVEIVDDA